jgi:hypothetical protein
MNPENKLVLAYDAVGAAGYWRSKGYTVLQVREGDFVNINADSGFTVDQTALRDAIDLLGLKLPVKLRYHSRPGGTGANYRLHRAGHHNIMVKSYLTPAQASEALWHELTHALQAERAGGTTEAWQKVLVAHKGRYKRCPLEIEARQMSETMKDCPLAR